MTEMINWEVEEPSKELLDHLKMEWKRNTHQDNPHDNFGNCVLLLQNDVEVDVSNFEGKNKGKVLLK